MSRGFVWFCLRNKKTDYVALSEQLGASIKKNNKHNNKITNKQTKIKNPNKNATKKKDNQ